jgi:acyl-CoA thioesterase FadM
VNLFFRLFWLTLFSRFRTTVPVLGPCLTPFRCLPTDLDVLRHMNNGRYFSIMDLARVDLLIRSKIAAQISRNGWYPVVVAETIRFRKSLKLFARFQVETTVVGWDERAFILQQKFWTGDTCMAAAVVRARVLKKTGGSVLPSEVLALAGVTAESNALSGWIRDWNQQQID